MINLPIDWSPSIQSYLIHRSPSHLNPYASALQIHSPMARLLLQEQNNKKTQDIYLQQLSGQLSQTPLVYILPQKLVEPFYFGQLSPKFYQVQDKQQVHPTYVLESHQQAKLQSLPDDFKNKLKHMIDLLRNFCGKEDEEVKIAKCRAQYSSDKALLAIFEGLLRKYRTCGKSREDMQRLVLRKAMSSIRDSMRGKYGLSVKEASLALCKKYFSSRLQELTENNIDLKDEDQILNFLLPYKKNSRNKTANGAFITEIFASEAFYEDYLQFLEKIDDILEADNKKRSKKLIDFLTACAQDGNFARIRSYKRLPWLEIWLVSVQDIAQQLLNTSRTNENRKKLVKCTN